MPATMLRRMALKCADRLGVYHLLRGRRRGVIALAYHGVEERILDERIQGVHLPLARFEKHVDYIRRNFEVLSLDELAERLDQVRGLDGHQVLFTFDDGYRNNFQVVAPVLNSHGLPFAVFVSSQNIGSGRRFTTYLLRAGVYLTESKRLRIPGLGIDFELSDETSRHRAVAALSPLLKSAPQETLEEAELRLLELHSPERWEELNQHYHSDAPMNWDEVRVLHEQGVEVGAHARTHCILHDQQDAACIHQEIHASREELTHKLGSCDYFAYPNGRAQDISACAVAEVEAAGYRLAFSSIFGEIREKSPRTLLPRIDADEDLDTLKFYLHTAYSPRDAHDGSDRSVSG